MYVQNAIFLHTMDVAGTLLDILKYTVPALIVLSASYLTVKKFLAADMQKRQLAVFKDAQDITLRLRLQAYERLVLFLERIAPGSMIPRVFVAGMTVRDLQQALIFNIRAEYEHNLAQQVYVSKTAWETVKNVKEQEINMVIQVGKSLDPEASGKELHARILDIILKTEQTLPINLALQLLNEEVKIVMSHGAM